MKITSQTDRGVLFRPNFLLPLLLPPAVIADSLSVSAPAQTLSKVEGDMLQLTCEVSRTTLQHTHLSVGWYLRSPEDVAAPPQELVTLSRDFVLRSGGPYRQRMSAGDLRLDKTSATAYRLTIHKLQPMDQGLLYCQAAEWIQDPDGSWFTMTRKQSDKTQLRIQPTGELGEKKNMCGLSVSVRVCVCDVGLWTSPCRF